MKWSEFLNDTELNSALYANPPSGKLLFNKLIHDVLECLNGYNECLKIATHMESDVPGETLNWFTKWETTVNGWIGEITSFEIHSRDLPDISLDWPNLISELGKILARAPQISKEADELPMPSSEKLKLAIQIAIRLIRKLNLLRRDIIDSEYKRLWTIQQYGNLIE